MNLLVKVLNIVLREYFRSQEQDKHDPDLIKNSNDTTAVAERKMAAAQASAEKRIDYM
jgi:hypothetical protein